MPAGGIDDPASFPVSPDSPPGLLEPVAGEGSKCQSRPQPRGEIRCVWTAAQCRFRPDEWIVVWIAQQTIQDGPGDRRPRYEADVSLLEELLGPCSLAERLVGSREVEEDRAALLAWAWQQRAAQTNRECETVHRGLEGLGFRDEQRRLEFLAQGRVDLDGPGRHSGIQQQVDERALHSHSRHEQRIILGDGPLQTLAEILEQGEPPPRADHETVGCQRPEDCAVLRCERMELTQQYRTARVLRETHSQLERFRGSRSDLLQDLRGTAPESGDRGKHLGDHGLVVGAGSEEIDEPAPQACDQFAPARWIEIGSGDPLPSEDQVHQLTSLGGGEGKGRGYLVASFRDAPPGSQLIRQDLLGRKWHESIGMLTLPGLQQDLDGLAVRLRAPWTIFCVAGRLGAGNHRADRHGHEQSDDPALRPIPGATFVPHASRVPRRAAPDKRCGGLTGCRRTGAGRGTGASRGCRAARPGAPPDRRSAARAWPPR